ncbi:MAG TPA: HD domain-containing phosphohydrolase, partial [Fimbriimonadaceae bacterium]|nr:HD domain-containing phosphohydrolase [Fimbriimonadaceae bacterium]
HMGFQSISSSARVSLALFVLLGAAAAAAALLIRLPASHASAVEFTAMLVLAAALGGRKLPLVKHLTGSESVSVSAGFAITFAAVLRLGPAGALLVGCLASVSASIYPKRRLFDSIQSILISAIASYLSGLTYLAVNGWTFEMRPVPTSLAIAGAVLATFAIESGGGAVQEALSRTEPVLQVWRERYLWTAPAYVGGAAAATLVVVAFGSDSIYLLFFAVPIGYVLYQSFATYAARAEAQIRRAESRRDVQESLAALYQATVKALVLAIDAKDQYTHRRILRVQRYAEATAERMGLDEGEMTGIGLAALLHDIGKLGVPEYVLLKPGKLTEEEFAKIKRHPEIGADILDAVEFPWPVIPAVKYHHERWDGSGYPRGLKHDAIPLGARILAVADVYDALTSSRSYRNAWTHAEALESISSQAGIQFDPRVVQAFAAVIDGVVAEMAAAGEGPLSESIERAESDTSKAAKAAVDIARTSAEAWALYEVSPTLSASLGLKETVDVLAKKLEAMYPGATCVFLLRAEGNRKLRAGAAVGPNHEFFLGAATVSQTSLSMQVVKSGEPYLGAYDKTDLLLSNSTTARWSDLGSAVILPIRCGASVLGTVNLYHSASGAFTAHDLQRLEMLAGRSGMAIYNGILHDRSRGQSETDSLTGLFNIRHLTSRIEERCASAEPFALLCIDMSSFKALNDTFGHHRGDKLLTAVGKLLRSMVARSGVVARYGGDEFLVVLDDADRRRALDCAAEIASRIADLDIGLNHADYGELKLAATVGVACFPDDGHDCSTLLCVADQEMYLSKTRRKLEGLSAPVPRGKQRAA